jgi:hypothetical protein
VLAEGLRRFEFEDETLVRRQADQHRFEVFGKLAATHLQRCRAHVEGRQEFLAIERGDPVMQGQEAVGTNGHVLIGDFLACCGQLLEHEQNGADGDRRIGDVEGRPVETGGMPLNEIDDRAEAHAVDDVAQRAAHDQRQGQREQLLLGMLL